MKNNYAKIVKDNLDRLYKDLPENLAEYLPAKCDKDRFVFDAFGEKCVIEPERITLHSLHNRTDYVDQLTSKITDQGILVEKSEERAEQKRLSYVKASTHKNAIEKLKERHQEKFRKTVNQEVAKIENEVAARISRRKIEK